MLKKISALIILVLVIFQANSQSFTQILSGTILGENGGRNYYCSWGDYNNDGFQDLYVVNNFDGYMNYLYKNNGDETFTQITEGEIVTDGGESYGCSWRDYDNDGYLDLFVCNYGFNNGLYHNNGNETFTKITTGAIVSDGGNSTCPDWGDYDNDGYIDLHVTNRDEANFLYHNNGDGTFTKNTSSIIATESKNSGAGAWGDYDGDGYLDLFVANAGPDYNSLFHNNGDGTFSKISEEPFTTDYQSFDCVSWGDIDNDGDLDLFAAPGILPYYFNLYLYENNGDGTFTRIPDLSFENLNSSNGTSMIDYDNDGDLDIIIMAFDGDNVILENDGLGNFTQNLACEIVGAGGSCGNSAWADYNNNGQLDLFIPVNNYISGYNMFFENNGNSNSWLKIKCEGTVSNSFGVGAVVSVFTTTNKEVTKQISVISNQQKTLIAHFGLGDAVVVDSIIVEWSSGIINKQYMQNVNEQITIIEEEETNITQSEIIDISIYPNPATDYLFINSNLEINNFQLINCMGEVIYFQKNINKAVINVSDLKAGIYFIRFNSDNQRYTEKIIIQ